MSLWACARVWLKKSKNGCTSAQTHSHGEFIKTDM
jgi:hypothetical protein